MSIIDEKDPNLREHLVASLGAALYNEYYAAGEEYYKWTELHRFEQEPWERRALGIINADLTKQLVETSNALAVALEEPDERTKQWMADE